MRIGLVWPECTFLVDPMVYPPLGLWYLQALLEEAGHQTLYFDLSSKADAENLDWMAPYLDQVWVSTTTPQWPSVEDWAVGFRRRYKERMVLGGPHASMHLEPHAHFDVVVGGEVSRANLSQVLEAEDGILHTGHILLSDLPVPSRQTSYRYHATLAGKKCTTMMTSWGCPFHCAFCSTQSLYGRAVRYLPLEMVEQDLDQCVKLGYGAIQFYDDILPIQPERTLRIADMLLRRDMSWRCFLRSDLGVRHGRSFLHALRENGLEEILVGVESGSDTVKRRINKGTTVEQDTILRQWCREEGISFKASIILGLPGETMETLQETRHWLLENQPDRVDVNPLIPMPGTPLWDSAEEYGCWWSDTQIDRKYFKGLPGTEAVVASTEGLSAREIAEFRLGLLDELRGLGIPY